MARTNAFAKVNTLDALEQEMDIVSSPENISHDGELTAREVRFRQKRISEDYITRRAQLQIAAFNKR